MQYSPLVTSSSAFTSTPAPLKKGMPDWQLAIIAIVAIVIIFLLCVGLVLLAPTLRRALPFKVFW